MTDRDARDGEIQGDVQAPQGQGGRSGHVGGSRRRLRAEFELDGGAIEEAVGAVQHAQLEQLDLGLRPRVVRHGRQYTHAP